MTAEREEVIDFIAPYYEQTGISIGEIFAIANVFIFYRGGNNASERSDRFLFPLARD